MANQLIQEIQLSDKGYSQGIQEAIKAVGDLAKENGVTEKSIGNVTREMRQAQKYAESLTATYSKLSKEAKSTEWGQAMAAEIDAAIKKAGELKDLREDISRQVKNVASDTQMFDTAKEGLSVLTNSMQLAASAAGAFADDEKTAVQMINLAASAGATLNTVIAVGNALQKESNIMQLVSNVQKKAGVIATNLETAAKGKNIVVTKAATVAQAAFNAVANMNPYILLATAAVAATAAIWAFASSTKKSEYEEQKASKAAQEHKDQLMLVSEYYDKTGRSAENLEKIQKNEPSRWRELTQEARLYKEQLERNESAHDKMASSVGDVTAKFMSLQKQWERLKTVGEQKKFIKDNQTEFNNLGLSINTVTDAMNAFVKMGPKVIKTLQAIAEASAAQSLYEEVVKKKIKNWDARRKQTNTGDFYYPYGGGDISDEEARAAGVRTKKERHNNSATAMYQSSYTGSPQYDSYTKEEIDKINKYREQEAIKLNKRLEKEYSEEVNKYLKLWEDYAKKAQSAVDDLMKDGVTVDPSGKRKPTKPTGGKTTKDEDPLSKYNKAMAEIAVKRQQGLLTEEKEIEARINAINEYCNALVKNGEVTEKDTQELNKLKPVLKQLRARLKGLQIEIEDNKLIKEANEEYADTIDKLNRDRENGWSTESDYSERYISALKKLTDKYKTVTNVSNELADEINKKIKVINNLAFEKNFKEFDIAVEGMIEDFMRVRDGLEMGNDYYNETRQARNTVGRKVEEYNVKFAASLVWKNLDDVEEQLDWIQENAQTAIELGVDKKDVDIIAGIGDALNMDTVEATSLLAAIETINNSLGRSKANEFLNLESQQEQLDWMHKHAKLVADTLKDKDLFASLMKMGDVTALDADQMETLKKGIDKLKSALEDGNWQTVWANEFREIIDTNSALLNEQEKKVHTIADAIDFADQYNASREFLSHSLSTQMGMVANGETNIKLDADVKLHFKKDDWEKFAKDIEDAGLEITTEILPENIEDIEKELQSMEISIDKDKFNKLITELRAIKEKLELDVATFDKKAEEYQGNVKIPQGGDASNYSLPTRSYEQVSRRNTQYKQPKEFKNFQDVTKTAMTQDVLDEKLKKYQEMEKILVEINEKNEKLGANIDTSGMIADMNDLAGEIDGLHDKIQKRLQFQVRMEGLQGITTGLQQFQSVCNDINSLGNLDEQLAQCNNGFEEFLVYLNQVITVMNIVNGVIEMVNTVMTVANLLMGASAVAAGADAVARGADATATGVQEAAEDTAIPTKIAEAAANKTLEASILDLAAAQIFAAHASIPFVGVGLATGFITSMMTAMAAQHAASLALQALAEGGIVDGNSFHGDTTLIRANKGEMVLNNRQQAHLFDALDSGLVGGGLAGEVKFKIEGDALVGTLKNHNKIKSRTGHTLKL